MPKDFYTINRFDGGINSKDGTRVTIRSVGDKEAQIVKSFITANYEAGSQQDARDVTDNMLEEAQNVMVDSVGKIRTLGSIVAAHANNVAAIVAGYGLFVFKSDYELGGTNTATEYIAMADSANSQIDLYENDASPAWQTNKIDLGTGTAMKAVMHYIDGVLRVTDATFDAGNRTKWYGYIKRTHFPGAQSNDIDGWQSENNDLAAPSAGMILDSLDDTAGAGSGDAVLVKTAAFPSNTDTEFDAAKQIVVNVDDTLARYITSRTDADTLVIEAGSSLASGDIYTIFPKDGLGFNIEYALASGGSHLAGTYEFAQTFIYDGKQESKPRTYGQTFAITEDQKMTFTIKAAGTYGNRVTGGRIYIRDTVNKDRSWILFADISLNEGVRIDLDDSYSAWASLGTITGGGTSSAPSSEYYYTASKVSYGLNLDTYETINGYKHNVIDIAIGGTGMGYKASCVGNRRIFVVAPKCKNEDADTVYMGDRIMYSQTNRFDTFLTENFIDIGVNDGDEFTAVATFADRLLAFKNNILYIVNISHGSDTAWFKESEHVNMGVSAPFKVFKTEDGIVWQNGNGCYFYNGQMWDGKPVLDLTDKIDDKEWRTDFVADDSWIFYIPYKKQVVVVRGNDGGTTDGNMYLYDFRTRSWIFGDSIFPENDVGDVVTNPQIDWNQDVIFAYDTGVGLVKKWSDTSVSRACIISFKDLTFNDLNRIKKIYNIYVSVKEKGSAEEIITVKYRKDGADGSWLTTNLDSTETIAADDEGVLVFAFSTPISVQSLQPQITFDGNIEINDVSIEKRHIYKRVS